MQNKEILKAQLTSSINTSRILLQTLEDNELKSLEQVEEGIRKVRLLLHDALQIVAKLRISQQNNQLSEQKLR